MQRILAAILLWALLPGPVGAQCGGVERWPVKVGSDAAASQISLTPVPIGLHQLIALPRPQLPSDDTTRLSQERTVYAVDGRLIRFKLESGRTGDRDYHLVISDDTLQYSPGGSSTTASPHSFIAEIVDPDCVPGRHGPPTTTSIFATQLAAVRTAFEQRFTTITGGWNEAGGIPVRVTGVGFFDRPHGQVGRAVNGIEIHPVIDITFNVAPPPPPTTLLQNGEFENGPQGWTATADVITTDANEPAHDGKWKAWLGGYGTPHTDTLWQQVSLPANATTVTLSFWLHISTEEQTTTEAYDKLRVRLRSATGQFIKTLKTFSNLQAATGFSLQTFDLTAYMGQAVRIELAAEEDNGSMTSFVVDDFAVLVE